MKTILVDAWATFFLENGVNEEMHKLLETYENPKIILTNANDEQVEKLGMANPPYELFSLKHNPDKVDPTYFKTMLEKYLLKPEDVIYFEHDADAVKSAESVGITSYHYNSEEKDIESLKKFIAANL